MHLCWSREPEAEPAPSSSQAAHTELSGDVHTVLSVADATGAPSSSQDAQTRPFRVVYGDISVADAIGFPDHLGVHGHQFCDFEDRVASDFVRCSLCKIEKEWEAYWVSQGYYDRRSLK